MSVTPSTEIVAKIRQRHLIELIARGKRLDGRDLADYREIKIESGVIGKAEGSALVNLGNTKVMAGVKISTGEPFPDTPNEGILTVNAELVPLASPTFELGPPSENAIELARVVDRGIRESKAIDLEKLCIVPGKNVFVVFIDVYILNHDGNLVDASALAALAAVLNAKIPNYEVKEGAVQIKEGHSKLPTKNLPITVTIAKIDGKLLVDPFLLEEQVMDAKISITIDQDEKICAIQKSGLGIFTLEMIQESMKIVLEKSKQLRKIVTG
ncbi:MAG TPA: exosome complex protein Rrp42 [archaeon]|nr:exosome complex protein Rrp42 [archaeon]